MLELFFHFAYFSWHHCIHPLVSLKFFVRVMIRCPVSITKHSFLKTCFDHPLLRSRVFFHAQSFSRGASLEKCRYDSLLEKGDKNVAYGFVAQLFDGMEISDISKLCEESFEANMIEKARSERTQGTQAPPPLKLHVPHKSFRQRNNLLAERLDCSLVPC